MLLGNGINFLSELFIKLANVYIYEKKFLSDNVVCNHNGHKYSNTIRYY